MRGVAAIGLSVVMALSAVQLSGCARGGELEPVVPEVVVEFVVTCAAPIRDAFYYYIALDADNDFGVDGPLPVAAGPNWGNGWGTGSITHYVEYHLGRYELFRVTLEPELMAAGGGIVGVAGIPQTTDAGVHAITIDTLSPGAATVSGTGAIAAVANEGLQAAGTLTLSTNAAGQVIAGSVAWTPAGAGGRALSAAEQAALDTLNAGGVALTADSLAALNLRLTLSSGPDLSGTQSIEVAQTTAQVTDRFTPEGVGPVRLTQSTLPANNDAPLTDGPIPGMTIRTTDLIVGQTARIRLLPDAVGTSLGFPYESVLPQGGRSLRVTLDLAQLGSGVRDLSINFVTTTELIFDPTVVNPDENVYDALGREGNDYFTIATNQFRTIRDGDLIGEEEADDPTLTGPATDEERAAVDIVDWSVTVRRLR
ncbi:MAG: hypothetical protein AB7Y46_10695 [Armatimonadota bacterium]